MKSLHLLFVLVFLPFISSAQGDRGCGVYQYFGVKHEIKQNGLDSVLVGYSGESPAYFDRGYSEQLLYPDTVLIEFNEEFPVHFIYDYYDEVMFFYLTDKIEWLRNDTLLDESEYSFQGEITTGACDDALSLESSLSVWEEGVYQLRTIGYAETNLPYFKVRKKQPAMTVMEVETTIVQVYPNPADDQIHVSHGTIESGSVQILDLSGKLVKKFDLDPASKSSSFHIPDVAKGTYVLKVIANNSNLLTSRLILI